MPGPCDEERGGCGEVRGAMSRALDATPGAGETSSAQRESGPDRATPTLDTISKGGRVRVRAVSGDDAIARRLGELGVRRGIEVEVLGRAPLGDPTVFELCGYQLCLRRTESARVEVEPLDGPGARR